MPLEQAEQDIFTDLFTFIDKKIEDANANDYQALYDLKDNIESIATNKSYSTIIERINALEKLADKTPNQNGVKEKIKASCENLLGTVRAAIITSGLAQQITKFAVELTNLVTLGRFELTTLVTRLNELVRANKYE